MRPERVDSGAAGVLEYAPELRLPEPEPEPETNQRGLANAHPD